MSEMIELSEISILQGKKGQTGGAQPAVYLDGAAGCLIPIIRACAGTTGHLIEPETCRERAGGARRISRPLKFSVQTQ